MAELVKWMKEPGQNVKVAHPGVGSFGHLAGVLVAQELGASRSTQVPYRGAGPALNDLLAGQVDLSSQSAVVVGPLVKAGKLKAYAIIGRNRFAGLPDLPTMGEARLQEARSRFLAHAVRAGRHATPDRRPAQRRAASRAGRRQGQKDFRRRRHGPRFRPIRKRPETAAALLKSEIKLWGDVIRANNITATQ